MLSGLTRECVALQDGRTMDQSISYVSEWDRGFEQHRSAVHSSTSNSHREWFPFHRPSKDSLGIIRKSGSGSSNGVTRTKEMSFKVSKTLSIWVPHRLTDVQLDTSHGTCMHWLVSTSLNTARTDTFLHRIVAIYQTWARAYLPKSINGMTSPRFATSTKKIDSNPIGWLMVIVASECADAILTHAVPQEETANAD